MSAIVLLVVAASLVASVSPVLAKTKAKASRHTAKQAEAAVVAEIKSRYLWYDPKTIQHDGVKEQASCSALTSAMFKCSWEAQNKDVQSFGKARVRFFTHGYVATFSDVSCTQNYMNPSSNPTAPSIQCDTDAHNG